MHSVMTILLVHVRCWRVETDDKPAVDSQSVLLLDSERFGLGKAGEAQGRVRRLQVRVRPFPRP